MTAVELSSKTGRGIVAAAVLGSGMAMLDGTVINVALVRIGKDLNASLAEWLIGSGRAPERYLAAQGTRLARAGRIRIAREGATVWVGGESVSCIRGDVEL